jgi:hypothetical protein
MGWGTTFLDYDNDGWPDIYVANDSYFSPYPNVLYRNQGDTTFTIVSQNQPESSPYGGYGTATLDLNRDGRLDLLIANLGNQGGNQYLENTTPAVGHWLQLHLTGTLSNRNAIGTQITVYAGEERWRDQVIAGSGYASQNSYWQHFGLGPTEVIDSLHLRWPSGREETYYELRTDQFLRFTENGGLTGAPTPLPLTWSATIAPNPVADRLRLLVVGNWPLHVRLSIINAAGQRCFGWSTGGWPPGGDPFLLPLPPGLPAGRYWLQIRSRAGMRSLPFLKG